MDSVTFWRQTLLFTVLYFKRESCLSNSVANVNVIYPLESVFLTTCRSPKGWLTLWRFQQQFVAVYTFIRGFGVDKSAHTSTSTSTANGSTKYWKWRMQSDSKWSVISSHSRPLVKISVHLLKIVLQLCRTHCKHIPILMINHHTDEVQNCFYSRCKFSEKQ